jgi:heat shock protein HslJ
MSNRVRIPMVLVAFLAAGSAQSAAAPQQDQRPPPPGDAPIERPTGLTGTKWQLVEIAYGNDTKAVPDDPSRYTIAFLPEGRAAVRADCNRGTGSYTVDGPRISLNVLAYTRAMCPPGSLFDKYSRNLNDVVSYVLKENRLHLAMKMDAGILTFDRVTPEP